MSYYVTAFITLALIGCSSTPAYNVIDKEFNFRLLLVEQPTNEGKQVDEFTVWDATTCIVILKKSEYPRCLKHGIRHCIEHKWHEGKITTEDC